LIQVLRERRGRRDAAPETRQQALDDCRELFPKFSGAALLGAFPDGVNDQRLPELRLTRAGFSYKVRARCLVSSTWDS